MNYLGMDLETTGLNTMTDEPVQVAWMVFNKENEKLFEKDLLIKTKVPISEGAQKIHGITREKVDNYGKAPSAVCEDYHQLIWQFKPVIIFGFNIINFDYIMWQNFLSRYKSGIFKHPPVVQVVDVMHLTSIGLRTNKWPKLSAAAEQLGISFDKDSLHGALADVELTWQVWQELLNQDLI
jgi:DNA polymerase III epsilon subunit-like protein